MKKILLFISIISLSITAWSAHPLHVSVFNLELREGKAYCKLSTFVDDWETAYFHYFGKQISFKEKEARDQGWFYEYLNASIKFSFDENESNIALSVDSVYFSEMSMTIEMHFELRDEMNSLYIYNALLTDIFADQNNLFIFSRGKKERGIKFDYVKRNEIIHLK